MLAEVIGDLPQAIESLVTILDRPRRGWLFWGLRRLCRLGRERGRRRLDLGELVSSQILDSIQVRLEHSEELGGGGIVPGPLAQGSTEPAKFLAGLGDVR